MYDPIYDVINDSASSFPVQKLSVYVENWKRKTDEYQTYFYANSHLTDNLRIVFKFIV